jgi:hypothetical protein
LTTGKLISPYLELCCLRISANVSYAHAAADVAMLTGMRVSANTQQRLVQNYEFPQAQAATPIAEASVDGGKVRLRPSLCEPSICPRTPTVECQLHRHIILKIFSTSFKSLRSALRNLKRRDRGTYQATTITLLY